MYEQSTDLLNLSEHITRVFHTWGPINPTFMMPIHWTWSWNGT